MADLHPSQTAAIRYVKQKAEAARSATRQHMMALMPETSILLPAFEKTMSAIKKSAPIDLSFHPDRLSENLVSVSEDLLETGLYKGQFETGISNGGLTAFRGGSRDRWEKRLFDGSFQRPDVRPIHRPKYGGLNLLDHWDGACPRFGSCYFRLRAAVAQRSTYTYGDSVTEPEDVGTIDVFDCVLAAVLIDVLRTGQALGGKDLEVSSVLDQLNRRHHSEESAIFHGQPGRSLDAYIEVQVHGPINLAADVEYLAADKTFQGTETGRRLETLATKYQFELHWHPGFMLAVSMVPPDFRGASMRPLARHVAPDGLLDAAKIGAAAASLRRRPELWTSWGSFDETLQYLKQLWHVLVAFGEPGHR